MGGGVIAIYLRRRFLKVHVPPCSQQASIWEYAFLRCDLFFQLHILIFYYSNDQNVEDFNDVNDRNVAKWRSENMDDCLR